MEPEDILRHIQNFFQTQTASFLSGQKVLLTSGPTQEAIDPVRYISNHSSGKMGAALAEALLTKGAEVHAVIGKGAVMPSPHPRLHVYPVSSAAEMFAKANRLHPDMQGSIFTAAVADYAPVEAAAEKIKKQGETLQLTLAKTVDDRRSSGRFEKGRTVARRLCTRNRKWPRPCTGEAREKKLRPRGAELPERRRRCFPARHE
ncbi:phosphopantothenoylcysteine decarboxylase/phosphopantothenate--cysteine ligase [Nitritalea halalkaliphila LW7]|uniref:Phosphopantothenoylcysteine decarboxylase/phosphopantothenate--cysteine ligase n=1 Tax=Nitritalea halalkaliphila LW7 TaxID=1189621 RepID=I5C2J0_9BACT|nr:phosphopantothenoylcysteine decarboxylase/phosphopantothenate--cysteine ligase [Nitritalea halalkaliphila LW7]